MIKAIIFDIGGVVCRGCGEDVRRRLCKKLKVKEKEWLKIYGVYSKELIIGTVDYNKALKNFSKKIGVNKRKLKKDWQDAYIEVMKVNPKIIKLVDNLKIKNYKIALITNTIKIHADVNKKRKLYSHFSPIILSYEVKSAKPSRKIYKITLKKLKLKSKECVVIDDREKFLTSAKKLGMKTILFKNNLQLKKDLKKFGIEVK